MTLNCFEHKMQFQKLVNLYETTFDDKDSPRFVTKKWIEVYINQKIVTILRKKLELKHQC